MIADGIRNFSGSSQRPELDASTLAEAKSRLRDLSMQP